MGPEPIIEGFAVETAEHLVFTVKGPLHPPGRVTAYLRYLPDPTGDRIRDGVRFRRVYHFDEQTEILNARFPHYLDRDPVLGIQTQSVPRARIKVVHDPCAHLARLRNRGSVDPVEGDVLDLAGQIQSAAAVSWGCLGISGSILLAAHRPDSDLDLLVYGTASAQAVHTALASLMSDPHSPVKHLDESGLVQLHAEHKQDTPLALDQFRRLQLRKVNEGKFRGRPFFIRFVKTPSEVEEQYGEKRYRYIGPATLQAAVVDDRDAIFTPCSYAVENADILDGPQVGNLCELVSYRGRFTDQVRVGEIARARGSLEQVLPAGGAAYHQLVIGGSPGDYLLAANESDCGASIGPMTGSPCDKSAKST